LKKALIFVDWFDPAYKAGGPIRSCVNLVRAMEQEVELYIVTSDLDLDGELKIAQKNCWVPYSRSSKVMYLSASQRKWNCIVHLFQNIKPDFVLLNSMYSRVFTIYPLLISRLKQVDAKFFIFPRGMLKLSALNIKKNKKKVFFLLAKSLFVGYNKSFIVSDTLEATEVMLMFPSAKTHIAANFSENLQKPFVRAKKAQGFLKIIFIGRIHPIKNLKYLLSLLVKTHIVGSLKIIGVKEDVRYWLECEKVIEKIRNVKVEYLGELPHEELYDHIIDSQLLVLPTLGENFGHAIAESIAAGRPVLISDRTPWKNLSQKGLGWEHSLDASESFIQSLETAFHWSQEEFDFFCSRCYDWCRKENTTSKLIKEYKKIFEDVYIGN